MYEVIYTATDSSGNTSSETRTVIVEDTTPPGIVFGPCMPVSQSTCGNDIDVISGLSSWLYDYQVIEIGFPPEPEPVMGYDFNCGGNVFDLGQPVITGDEIDYNTVGYYTQLYTVTDNAGNSTSVEITFQVIDPLSVSESNIDNIYLSPNPAENIVSINNIYSDTDISLYDILGKQYELNRINNFENNTLSLNTSNLETGIYFIRIQDINSGQLKTLRLIKQ